MSLRSYLFGSPAQAEPTPPPAAPTFWRADGYMSAVASTPFGASSVVNRSTGFGIPGIDGGAANQGVGIKLRTDVELTWLYLRSGIAARIVDAPADDALARGFVIEGDDGDLTILGECERLDVIDRLSDAIRWARLLGGAAILIVADDGGTFEEPLNEARIASLQELRVYDATAIRPDATAYIDPQLANYGMPEFYMIQPAGGGAQFRVHDTRLILVSGEVLPAFVARQRDSGLLWRGRSALEGCYDSLLRYSAGMQWSERMLERKQQAVYSMVGLAEMIQHGMEGLARTRIGMVDVVRSVLNTVVIDGGAGAGQNATPGDKYEVRDLNMSNVPDTLHLYQQDICADTGFPVTVLFGRSPAGHNATGESDMESYYRMVGQLQRRDAQPVLKRLIELILVQKDYSGARPAEWELEFNPLWLPSDKEQAETAQANALADKASADAAVAYMDSGVMTNVDVRADLVAQNKYGLTGTVELVDNTAVAPLPTAPGGTAASDAQAAAET
jgi:uncharacterized protein